MRYKKKPVEIEAVQWTGENLEEVIAFCKFVKLAREGRGAINLYISTFEGIYACSKGDYIIKGIAGEFYPCKPDIFKATYEEVGE